MVFSASAIHCLFIHSGLGSSGQAALLLRIRLHLPATAHLTHTAPRPPRTRHPRVCALDTPLSGPCDPNPNSLSPPTRIAIARRSFCCIFPRWQIPPSPDPAVRFPLPRPACFPRLCLRRPIRRLRRPKWCLRARSSRACICLRRLLRNRLPRPGARPPMGWTRVPIPTRMARRLASEGGFPRSAPRAIWICALEMLRRSSSRSWIGCSRC